MFCRSSFSSNQHFSSCSNFILIFLSIKRFSNFLKTAFTYSKIFVETGVFLLLLESVVVLFQPKIESSIFLLFLETAFALLKSSIVLSLCVFTSRIHLCSSFSFIIDHALLEHFETFYSFSSLVFFF